MAEQFSLGAIIRQRRLELGWTQEELAERISTDDEYVRQSEISRIENGRVGLPRRDRLLRLAAALELPAGELLAYSGWGGADILLQNSGNAATSTQPWQATNRENAEPASNGIPGQHSNSVDRRSTRTADQTAIENLRRALAALHEQTDRLSHNRDRSAQILEQVQRSNSDPDARKFTV